MNTAQIGVLKESAPGERWVATVPETIARLRARGADILIERGAGLEAKITDDAFAVAGAHIVDVSELLARAELLLCVRTPTLACTAGLREGQTIAGLFDPLADRDVIDACARRGATVLSLVLLPRTLSRAQAMDALTSQANIAGYRAAVLAAAAYERFFPTLTTPPRAPRNRSGCWC